LLAIHLPRLLNGRTRAKLAGAAEKLGNSDRVAFIAADITQPANAQTIVDAALERFGRLDVLVNNAGIFYNKPFTDYSSVARLIEQAAR
jgi:NAD(P)-dependent dehydrogenase (short-subunit alcohol dehydrogenase family)